MDEFWDGRGIGSIAARSTKKPRLCVCGCGASAGTANWSVPAVVEGSTKLPRSTSGRYAICHGRIPHDGSDRALSSALSGLRDQGRESTATAEQGAFQQAL